MILNWDRIEECRVCGVRNTMAALYRSVMDTFWSEYIWLPPNTTWKDIAPDADPNIQHADYRHLFYPLPMALVIFVLRYVFEKSVWGYIYLDIILAMDPICYRYWFEPVGLSLGIKNTRPKKAPSNTILEKAYITSKKWKHKQVRSLEVVYLPFTLAFSQIIANLSL